MRYQLFLYFVHSEFFSLFDQAAVQLFFNFVRRLPIVGQPFAFGQLHIRENCTEGRVLRAAGIHAKPDFALRFMQMADAHLMERLTILRTLDAEIVFPAA